MFDKIIVLAFLSVCIIKLRGDEDVEVEDLNHLPDDFINVVRPEDSILQITGFLQSEGAKFEPDSDLNNDNLQELLRAREKELKPEGFKGMQDQYKKARDMLEQVDKGEKTEKNEKVKKLLDQAVNYMFEYYYNGVEWPKMDSLQECLDDHKRLVNTLGSIADFSFQVDHEKLSKLLEESQEKYDRLKIDISEMKKKEGENGSEEEKKEIVSSLNSMADELFKQLSLYYEYLVNEYVGRAEKHLEE